MVVGEMPEGVDLVVVGGGPGGYVAAIAAAQLGRQVVLVDADGADGLGGVCVRVGCIPSKALIELAHHVHDGPVWAKRGAPAVGGSDVDLAAFQTFKNDVVSGLNAGVRGLLKSAGVDVRQGYFRLTRPDQGALVTDPEAPPSHLQFASCILATGSRPMPLAVLPVDGMRIVGSTGVLDLDELPARVAVVGGGYIGIELGTALAKLGSAVTIVEAESTLLPTMDPAAGRAVTKRLKELGVTVRTSTTVTGDDGQSLRVTGSGGEEGIEVDLVVVAIGRVPNTDDLGLEAIGVAPGPRGLLEVGPDRLLTPRIAAIGDITPGPALAHKASAEAHVAAAVLSGHREVYDPRTVSAVIFSDPEIAQTGLTVQEAEAAGHTVRRSSFPVSASGRARTMGASAGQADWIVDDGTGIVLGALIIGPHATELIGEAALAIEMGAHLEDIAGTIHPHPTMSEMLHESALVALDRPVHVPRGTR